MKGPAWTRREVYRLLIYAETVSQAEAAKRLGRSLWSVQTKARLMGVRWRQGRESLAALAREMKCSETTVAKLAAVLFWDERVHSGRQNGRRYHLTFEQAERLRAVLARNLKRHAAHRAAGKLNREKKGG